MNTLWQQELARLGLPGLAQLVSEIRDAQVEMMANMDSHNIKMAQHETALERLLTGFPAADIEGHRRYHESVIEARELRNKLVRTALEKAVGSGVLFGLGWLLLAAWEYFKLEVKK